MTSLVGLVGSYAGHDVCHVTRLCDLHAGHAVSHVTLTCVGDLDDGLYDTEAGLLQFLSVCLFSSNFFS